MRKLLFAYAKTMAQISCVVSAGQRLCLCQTDSAKCNLSLYPNFLAFSVAVQPSLCQTWSKTPKKGFLAMRLI